MTDDYQYVTYETLDEGRIARIMLNRPEARNAQNRGLLVELDEAFLQAEDDDKVRVVILGGVGPDVLRRPRHGLGGGDGGVRPGPTSTRPSRSTAAPASAPRTGCCRSGTTSSRTPGAGATCARSPSPRCTATVFAAGLMLMWACDLIVAADDVTLRRRGGHPPRHVRRRVLRPPVGVRAAQDQGADAHRRLASTSRRRTSSAWCSKIFPADELADKTLEFARRIAKLPTMTALLIKESVNQTQSTTWASTTR